VGLLSVRFFGEYTHSVMDDTSKISFGFPCLWSPAVRSHDSSKYLIDMRFIFSISIAVDAFDWTSLFPLWWFAGGPPELLSEFEILEIERRKCNQSTKSF